MNDPRKGMGSRVVTIVGARQNNLTGFDVSFPKGQLTAVTGLSGSGKSSLVFDTLYAEGQRRYVESFSTYARQFLERMDRPDMDRVDGLLPAIALEQRNTIRSARATLATLTELTEYLKLLFSAQATLFCPVCGESVAPDTPGKVTDAVLAENPDARAVITFPFRAGKGTDAEVALSYLASEGFTRVLSAGGKPVRLESLDTAKKLGRLDVIADRIRLRGKDRARIVEGLELAYRMGEDEASVHVERSDGWSRRDIYRGRRCCGTAYTEPRPGLFSFGSPIGACTTCNGFGRVMGVDEDRVVPDVRLPLAGGAIKPWGSPKRSAERRALMRACSEAGIDVYAPWSTLTEAHKRWIFDGAPGRQSWRSGWPGVHAWFRKLERKSYRMHVRILLSRYRSYTTCPDCDGSRLKAEALLYRLGGHTIAEVFGLSVKHAKEWLDTLLGASPASDEALAAVIEQLHGRLGFLDEVGLGYLTLNRQARTLSGGEVQRANLTTAVGSGLVNTLFVFDEPSVGLHARDAARVSRLLRRLTERENTVVVVEHDPDILTFADHAIELGPGPGASGGRIAFQGRPHRLAVDTSTATGRALQRPRQARLASRDLCDAPGVRVVGARAQNLQDVSVTLPQRALTVVTGVSGSGKSTLIEQVLYRGIARARGQITDPPGACDGIDGLAEVGEVVWVDAAPPASNPRANPATYVKAWSIFRGQLAKQPLAKERGYAPGTFSFNSGTGRCPVCEGAGVERIEMQFLSDVFLTCEACEGRRFTEEVLEVRWNGLNAADILGLTVDEALAVFATHRVSKKLKALADAGLGYLRLGQPLATLSGGEAQRLKVAHHTSVLKTRGALLLLDEPTTGLHLEDVQTLVSNLRMLVDAGNSVVVIEHHLDVIAAADHIIDLGPDGGDGGGQLVYQGPPTGLITSCTETGRQLARWRDHSPFDASNLQPAAPLHGDGQIVVEGARVHNLKNISVRIPRSGRTVVSGVSGSGKSSLAFDLIFAEGQRRFLDCLSPYARQYIQQLGRPDADRVYGIPPTVAIEQRTTRGGRWSTVANVTEIEPFLRILWARIGRRPDEAVDSTVDDVVGQVVDDERVQPETPVGVLAEIVRQRKGLHRDVFERAAQSGFDLVVNDEPVACGERPELRKTRSHTIAFVIGTALAQDVEALSGLIQKASAEGDAIWVRLGDTGPSYVEQWRRTMRNPDHPRRSLDPRLFSPRTDVGRCQACQGRGFTEEDADGDLTFNECPQCWGDRLGPVGRKTDIRGMTLPKLITRTPSGVLEWIDSVHLGPRERTIAEGPLKAITERAQFLIDVGLDYLTLDRRVPTLSGGESQRIRLAAQLGAHLSGVLYVLDEPTIGLHPTDVDRLLETLDELEGRGNGVLMVEHDEKTLRTADMLVDVGPGAGREGGEIMAAGPLDRVLADPASVTGRCLAAPRPRVREAPRALTDVSFMALDGVVHHNIEGADVRIPRGRLTVVTGVSGSGKSSLAIDVLRHVVTRATGNLAARVRGIAGLERFVLVDDKPVGKNPRSTPATYVGVWDHIRTLFAKLPEAKIRGFARSRFSFNVKGGRCNDCAGQGRIKVEMSFLPDAYVVCQTCGGGRFNRQTQRVTWQGHSIADVLALPVRDAAQLFEAVPKVKRALTLMDDVGLGYLRLGQPSPTLSGGESQRLKLVSELLGRGRSDTVIVLDEPTIGLHMADVPKLLTIFHRLVDSGATMVVIEHNMDVVREADWVIDMGPGPGALGGEVVYQGPEAGLRNAERSATGRYLRTSG